MRDESFVSDRESRFDRLKKMDAAASAPPAPAPTAGNNGHVLLTKYGGRVEWGITDRDKVTVRHDGAVALLDRLGTLPGFDHRTLVQAMSGGSPGTHVLWKRAPQRSLSTS